MNIQPVRMLVALAVAVLLHSQAWAFSVTFISPGRHDEAYWLSASRAMQAAADNLGIQFEVLYSERDALQMVNLTREVTHRSRKPDYLMVVNEKLAGPIMLQLANAAAIKVFLSYNAITPDQRQETGRPREKYKYWIGSLASDNDTAGELTMQQLLEHARSHFSPGTQLNLLMMAGDRTTPSSTERIAGARKVLAKWPGVQLTQLVYGEWNRTRAYQQGQWLLTRYPHINLIWTANDEMAFGLEDAMKLMGKHAGADILISSVNNSTEAMHQRENGQLSSLAAGHFMTGAWSLVMLYDYHNGKDFADGGLEQRSAIFSAISPRQASQFLQRFGSNDFHSINFKQYSRVATPGLANYSFKFSSVLN